MNRGGRAFQFSLLTLLGVLLCSSAARAPLNARQADKSAPAVIRVSATLVQVPVSVTDAAGEPVRGLTAEDFRLEEEGRPQDVTMLGEPGQTPLELALLFDVSGSVRDRFQFQQEVAARFLREVLKPADSVSVFSVGLVPRRVQSRTPERALAVERLLGIEPTREATAFFDAVTEAAIYLRQTAAAGSRRVQVVISDGEDNQSERYRLDDALRELQRADCIFYAINPSGPSIRLNKISTRGHAAMESLANPTGGAAFLPDRLEDMESVFRRITAELQAQYLLGYYAPAGASAGQFRRLTLRVPKRPELRLRTRQGYYALAP